MKNTIIVSEDTTLGAEHSGMRIVVDAAATITLPHEDTYKNIAGDENEIISCVTGNVKIKGEEGVTVIPTSAPVMAKKGASIKVLYQGDNKYLIWGSLCLALVVGAVVYNYNVNLTPESAIMFINWMK